MTAAVAEPLREVRLYGALGRQFGRLYRLAVSTPAEAVRALRAVLPGFERAFLGPDGRAAYHVFVGRGSLRRDIGRDEADAPLGAAAPIRFVPVVQGASKRGGLLQIVAGYVLIFIGAAVIYASDGAAYGAGQAIANVGVAMIVGGVIQVLSPQRKGKTSSGAEQTPSYAFDGPVNNTEQGGPVPCVFGRVICGSTVVSQGISSEELVVDTGTPPAPVTLPDYEPQYPTTSDGA